MCFVNIKYHTFISINVHSSVYTQVFFSSGYFDLTFCFCREGIFFITAHSVGQAVNILLLLLLLLLSGGRGGEGGVSINEWVLKGAK